MKVKNKKTKKLKKMKSQRTQKEQKNKEEQKITSSGKITALLSIARGVFLFSRQTPTGSALPVSSV